MKPAPFLLVLAITFPALAQNKNQTIFEHVSAACRGSVMAAITTAETTPAVRDPSNNRVSAEDPLTSPAFVNASAKILAAFKTMYPASSAEIALISSNEINAWQLHPSDWVCVPTAMTSFMDNEDELAFILGHELGHVVDSACAAVTLNRQNQIICEMRADAIGFRLLVAAGYSPYAAAGAFGRLEMYSGDIETGISGLFRQLASDHPITPNRIANMRRLLLAETHP